MSGLVALALLMGSAHAETIADCGDARKIEKQARVGKLPQDTVDCLEQTRSTTVDPATRAQTSRLLIHDAWSRGDRTMWVRLVEHHLTTIDDEDPELTYQYASHALKTGNPQTALDWLEVSLEHRFQWSPRDRPGKLYNLYLLRARAARARFEELDRAAVAHPSQENRLKANVYLGRARLYAIELARHAIATSRAPGDALAMCAATGWDPADCEAAANEVPP